MALEHLESLFEKSISGDGLSQQEIAFVINYPEDRVGHLMGVAHRIKEYFFGNIVSLCSIVNAKSGGCSEDCAFCAQSAHYKTGVRRRGFLSLKSIVSVACSVKKRGVGRFAMVTSGRRPSQRDIKTVCEAVLRIKKCGGVKVDVSLGELTREDIVSLKDAGVDGIHGNLETSSSYFPRVCTTHSYRDKLKSLELVKEEGMFLCSGGLFGMGESWQDRVELALTLKGLSVDSVPINFLMPIKGTPLQDVPALSFPEALKIVVLFRLLLPDKEIRVCGGRNVVFDEDNKRLVLRSGASGIMVGNYLTRRGFDIASDLRDLSALGMSVV